MSLFVGFRFCCTRQDLVGGSVVTLKFGSLCTSATWSTDPYRRSGKLSSIGTVDFELGQGVMLSKELASNLLFPSFAMVK